MSFVKDIHYEDPNFWKWLKSSISNIFASDKVAPSSHTGWHWHVRQNGQNIEPHFLNGNTIPAIIWEFFN